MNSQSPSSSCHLALFCYFVSIRLLVSSSDLLPLLLSNDFDLLFSPCFLARFVLLHRSVVIAFQSNRLHSIYSTNDRVKCSFRSCAYGFASRSPSVSLVQVLHSQCTLTLCVQHHLPVQSEREVDCVNRNTGNVKLSLSLVFLTAQHTVTMLVAKHYTNQQMHNLFTCAQAHPFSRFLPHTYIVHIYNGTLRTAHRHKLDAIEWMAFHRKKNRKMKRRND